MYKCDRYKNENNNNVSTILIIIQQNFLNIDNHYLTLGMCLAKGGGGEKRKTKQTNKNTYVLSGTYESLRRVRNRKWVDHREGGGYKRKRRVSWMNFSFQIFSRT